MRQLLTKLLIALTLICISSCGDSSHDSSVDVWRNRVEIIEDAPMQQVTLFDDSGDGLQVDLEVRDWEPGQEYIISAVWDGSTDGGATIMFYVDGELVAARSDRGRLFRYTIPLERIR